MKLLSVIYSAAILGALLGCTSPNFERATEAPTEAYANEPGMPEPAVLTEVRKGKPRSSFSRIFLCDKTAKEQGLTLELVEDAQSVGIIRKMEPVDRINCDGTVEREKELQRVADAQWHVHIPALGKFPEPVRGVIVRNLRTCVTRKIDSRILGSSELEATMPYPDGTFFERKYSAADEAGAVRLFSSDLEIRNNLVFGFRDGHNLLQLEYYGECLEPTAGAGEVSHRGFWSNCKRAKLLGQAWQDVNLIVRLDEGSQVRTRQDRTCEAERPIL